jgi:hypothetical protein
MKIIEMETHSVRMVDHRRDIVYDFPMLSLTIEFMEDHHEFEIVREENIPELDRKYYFYYEGYAIRHRKSYDLNGIYKSINFDFTPLIPKVVNEVPETRLQLLFL